VFQGEEWAASTPFLYFTDHHEPELGETVKRGRQEEFASFGWEPGAIPDPQEEETFLQSKLDWKELQREQHQPILDWHRSLITLRRRLPSLCDGRMERTSVRFDEEARWLIMRRGPVLVVCNFSNAGQQILCPESAGKRIVLASEKGIMVENNTIFLPGQAVAIVAD
jgi:maltooligosyltrehalose trehalohydrolase